MSQIHDELIHHNHAYNRTQYCTSCTQKVIKSQKKLWCKAWRPCYSPICSNSSEVRTMESRVTPPLWRYFGQDHWTLGYLCYVVLYKIHHMSHVDLKLLELWKEVSKLKKPLMSHTHVLLSCSFSGGVSESSEAEARPHEFCPRLCTFSQRPRGSTNRQTASILHDPFIIFHLSSVNLLPSKPSSQQERTAAMFLLISWAGLLASGVTLWV